MKKSKQGQQQRQAQAQSVYTKRQKSRRHRKLRPYSDPDPADEGWSPAVAGARSDLPPGNVEDRFLPRSLREMMWLKKVVDLPPGERRRYLKSRRKTNPEVGDVAGMRRRPVQAASLRRKRGESQGRFLARVERTAQQTLLASQYADRFGSATKSGKDNKSGRPDRASNKDGNAGKQQQRAPLKRPAAAEAEPDGASPEKAERHQRRRRPIAARPGRLAPVASEPPKSLGRLKFQPRKSAALFAAAAASGGGDGGGGGGGGSCALDRRLLLT